MKFEYKLNQPVKVQVFNLIVYGTIVKREYHENNTQNAARYHVQLGTDTEDIVTPWEQELLDVQELPLGEMK